MIFNSYDEIAYFYANSYFGEYNLETRTSIEDCFTY